MNDDIKKILELAFVEFLKDQKLAMLITKDRKIIWANQAAEEKTGYTLDDVVGKNSNEMGILFDLGGENTAISKRVRELSTEPIQDREFLFRIGTKDNRVKWYIFNLIPVNHAGHEYSIITFQDINMIKESEEKFRIISEDTSIGMLILQDGLLKYINPAMSTITGYAKMEVEKWEANEFFNAIHPDERILVKKRLETLLADDKIDMFHHELRIITSEKKIKTVSMTSHQIHYEGRPAIFVVFFDLTERISLEKQILESERKFRTITEHSTMGIAIIQDNAFVFVNETLTDLLGYPREELMVWSLEQMMSLVPPELEKNLLQRHHKHLMGKEDANFGSNYDLEIETKNGLKRVLQIYSKPVLLRGKYADLITAIDITSQKISQSELIESEQKFKSIAENSSLGIVILENNSKMIKYVNTRAAEIFGYPISDVNNWTSSHLLMKTHPDDRVEFENKIRDFTKEKTHGSTSARIISKNGIVRWLDIYASRIKYQTKNAILLMIADRTPEKVAERIIKESEQKYKQIFENSAASIILVDSRGMIMDCNPATENLFELSRERLVGRKIKDFSVFFKQYDVFVNEFLRELNRGKSIKNFELNVELVHNDGTSDMIWVSADASRIKFGKKFVNQLIIHDITDKKRLEQLQEKEINKLKELDSLRKNFISTATHELKTPLVSIYGATEFLATSLRDELGENALKLIDIIYRGAKRLKESIDDILQVSRMESGSFMVEFEELDLAPLVRSVLKQEDYLIKMSEHVIKVDIPEQLNVFADMSRIEQVITNLLTNAIKNTPPGGKITIAVTREKDSNLHFMIEDTGIGLTPDEMDALFTQFGKFNRTDLNTPVNIQGTGLGLYISKNIIDLHGGRIWAESEGRNKGSTFHFTIPRLE